LNTVALGPIRVRAQIRRLDVAVATAVHLVVVVAVIVAGAVDVVAGPRPGLVFDGVSCVGSDRRLFAFQLKCL
jgi:hypothetical protein